MATHGDQGDDFRIIAGRYRLEVRVGRGGMGVVWQATDQLLGRRVAVKELPIDETLSASEARRQRELTLREAQAVAQLSHPNIVVVHDVVEDDERPCIVMELVDGDSLADRLAAHGPVDAHEAARIGADLLGALRTAHAAGVLHRDITPANVLIENGTDRVVLTDFGIARLPGTSTLTESGSFVGSPEYTAPERMSGARTGPASDLWSVGALLCAALSGESPFRRDSLSGIVLAVVSAEIRPPAQAEPILPVVQGLLERDPGRRLDAAGAEHMLRTFLETGSTVLVKRFGSAEHRYSTRTKLAMAVLVAAMAVAGISAAALLVNGGGDGGVVPTGSAPENSGEPTGPGASTSPGASTASGTPAPSGTPTASGAATASGTPTASGAATPSATSTASGAATPSATSTAPPPGVTTEAAPQPAPPAPMSANPG